jgi:hypothetical protein
VDKSIINKIKKHFFLESRDLNYGPSGQGSYERHHRYIMRIFTYVGSFQEVL